MAHVPSGFWEHWGDGRAEMNAYTLVTPRYGELRHGRTVLVFVTEDFTDAQRVKSDGGHPDAYPVLKLHEARDFQTGIYDYNVAASTFVRIDGQGALGVPVKVSLSVQDWCGHVYEQLVPRGDALIVEGHSYFDGEADHERKLAIPSGAVLLDAMPIVARGIAGTFVEPGGSVEVRALPTLLSARFAHEPVAWTTATVTRSAGTSRVTVPAGTFEVFTVATSVKGGVTTTWRIEAGWPHRIVGWSGSDGEEAALLGSSRIAYWENNQEGKEALLAELGLPPPVHPPAERP